LRSGQGDTADGGDLLGRGCREGLVLAAWIPVTDFPCRPSKARRLLSLHDGSPWSRPPDTVLKTARGVRAVHVPGEDDPFTLVRTSRLGGGETPRELRKQGPAASAALMISLARALGRPPRPAWGPPTDPIPSHCFLAVPRRAARARSAGIRGFRRLGPISVACGSASISRTTLAIQVPKKKPRPLALVQQRVSTRFFRSDTSASGLLKREPTPRVRPACMRGDGSRRLGSGVRTPRRTTGNCVPHRPSSFGLTVYLQAGRI